MKDEILPELRQLLELNKGIAIALVGAGGKTSLMSFLARQLPRPVICTTSTKLAAEEAHLFDRHIVLEEGDILLPEFPENGNAILLTSVPLEVEGIEKLSGLTEEQLLSLNQFCKASQIPLIIEADGSKRRPLKAPEEWEPVIPAFTDLVITVVGLAGLLKPLNDENVFRSQMFSELTGLESGQAVDLDSILRFLKHPMGGQKGIPDQAKHFVLFNLAGCAYPELIEKKLIETELCGFFDGIYSMELYFSQSRHHSL
jgi:probable selenium-dependent hydroxylase accessory protein YqeC